MQVGNNVMTAQELRKLLIDEDLPVEVDFRINWKEAYCTEYFNACFPFESRILLTVFQISKKHAGESVLNKSTCNSTRKYNVAQAHHWYTGDEAVVKTFPIDMDDITVAAVRDIACSVAAGPDVTPRYIARTGILPVQLTWCRIHDVRLNERRAEIQIVTDVYPVTLAEALQLAQAHVPLTAQAKKVWVCIRSLN